VKTNLIRVVVAAVLLSGAAAKAQWGPSAGLRQGQTIWALNWEVAGPIGDFQNYIKNWSLLGFSLEARYLIKKNISVGGSFSFNRWEETYSQISIPVYLPNSGATGVASGPVYRYNDMFGLRAIVHYYFGDGGTFQPYVGTGIGGVWSYSYQQIADLANTQDSFNFIVSPEAGVLYTLMSGTTSLAINLAFRYTFTTASPGRTSNAQTIGPIIGLAWYY
jgi:opacity protein-like surface antigen